MAVWQYDFAVVPRDAIAAISGGIPVALTSEQFKSIEAWKNSQPSLYFEREFNEWRPQIKSWSPSLRIWGEEASNRIDVSYNNDKVRHIEFRVELRSMNNHFIELLASFSQKNNCLLVSMHSLVVVEPLRQNILLHLCRSPGANSVLDWLFHPEGETNLLNYPKVFLSHSSADKSFVSRLAVDLRSRKVPVWFDKWELKVGDSLTQKIEEGIDDSGWLVVVLSKNSVSSDWVQKELRAAQARELRDKQVFVLPVLIDDCKIPLFLLDKLYADFRNSYVDGLEQLLRRVIDGE